MLETFSKILFVISTGALVPVMLSLIGLAVWTLLLLGGLVREAASRWAARCLLGPAIRTSGSDGPTAAAVSANLPGALVAAGFISRYLRACWLADATQSAAGRITDEIELEMAQSVASLSTIARIGPMLGLAGTLIPLGPGLVSLARGDVATLANQLVIAFSTTVVGLLVGIIAYVSAQLRRRWYARDLALILQLEDVRVPRGGSNPS